MCSSGGPSGWQGREREAAERALTALPRAAVSSLLSLLPSSQDDANLPSRLLLCCPDLRTSSCSYPWVRGRYLKKNFTKPDQVQEALLPGSHTNSAAASLGRDEWGPSSFPGQGCRAQRARAEPLSLGSLFCYLFGPQSWAASPTCHLLAKAGSEQEPGREVPKPSYRRQLSL